MKPTILQVVVLVSVVAIVGIAVPELEGQSDRGVARAPVFTTVTDSALGPSTDTSSLPSGVATTATSGPGPTSSPMPAPPVVGSAPSATPVTSTSRSAPDPTPTVVTTNSGPSSARFAVVELSLEYPTTPLRDPWIDATASATFTSASGKETRVQGFYFDRNTYKVRFAPDEPGTYTYTATIDGPTPFAPQSGRVTATRVAGEGFIRRLGANPSVLGFADGTRFNALGLNDCWYADPSAPDRLDHLYIEAGQAVDPDTYFATYASAGFNLMRWGIDNCNFAIGTLPPFLVNGGKDGDQLLQAATSHGFHVMLTMFHEQPYPDVATNPTGQAAVAQYLNYVMARYGAYTDIWELTNETETRTLPDSWLEWVASYVRAHDPYHHLVTNSNPRDGDWNYLDARSPHFYFQDTPDVAVGAMEGQIDQQKKNGLPVIIGEMGNQGCNWDPTSATRMRIHLWTAFFDEAEVVFWNSSAHQNYCPGGAANIYLGPQEREYTRTLQDFTATVDSRAVPVRLTSLSRTVRGSGLRSPSMFVAYLTNATTSSTVSTTVDVDAPVSGTAIWLDPASGKVVLSEPVSAGPQTLSSPSFAIDLALVVR